jgi:hypothetical protein
MLFIKKYSDNDISDEQILTPSVKNYFILSEWTVID